MLELLAQTASLLRRRPLCWIPVLAASLVAFALHRLEAALNYSILVALLPHRSILDRAPDFHQVAATAPRTLIYTLPIGLIIIFLIAVTYSIALLLTASLAWTQTNTERLPASALLGRKAGRIAAFSAKATGVYFLPGLFVTVLLLSTPPFPHNVQWANNFLEILHLAVAFVVARWALDLLRPADVRRLPDPLRNQAGYSAVLAFIVSTLLVTLIVSSAHNWLASHPRPGAELVFGLLLALVESLPLVFLFVLLSVLAASDGLNE